jgi:hypothetical protein
MTRSRYDIVFHNRTVGVLRDDAALARRPGTLSEPYESIAEAADLALKTLRAAVDSSVDESVFARERLLGLDLRLVGEGRELDAACLHWHLRWGVDHYALRALPRETRTSPSIYATLGFGSHLARLETVRALLRDWAPIAGRARQADERNEVPTDLRARIEQANRKPRIGIVGVTGAGKSSFINAVLGRDVASVSEGNATGCITQFRWVASTSAEGVTIELRSRKEISEQISAFRGETLLKQGKARLKELAMTSIFETEALVPAEQYERKRREIEGLEACLKLKANARWPISDIERFTNVERSPLAHGIRRVTVDLHAPILERVTLVDTPGTHDVSEARGRVAIAEATTFDGWFYLVSITEKPQGTFRDDWEDFDKGANNRRAALILTKLDRHDSGPLRDIEKQRAEEYGREGWRRGVVACSAAPHFRERDASWGTFVVAAMGMSERQDRIGCRVVRRRIEDLDAVEGAWKDRVVDDYTRDLAGIVRAGFVMAGVAEQAALAHAEHSAAALLESIEACEKRLSERERVLAADRENWDQLAQLEDDQTRDQRRIEALRRDRQERDAVLQRLRREHETTDAARLRRVVMDRAKERIPSRMRHDEVVKDQIKHHLWGSLEFNVLREFEAPLASLAQEQLQSILSGVATDLQERLAPRDFSRIAAFCVLTNVTLVSPERMVTDEEKFFEFVETALARMYPVSVAGCERARDAVLATALAQLGERCARMFEIAAVSPLAEELHTLEVAVTGRATTIAERRKHPLDPPARLDQQVQEVRALLAEVVAFREGIARSGEAPPAT